MICFVDLQKVRQYGTFKIKQTLITGRKNGTGSYYIDK